VEAWIVIVTNLANFGNIQNMKGKSLKLQAHFHIVSKIVAIFCDLNFKKYIMISFQRTGNLSQNMFFFSKFFCKMAKVCPKNSLK
jgi:hypothetical protein